MNLPCYFCKTDLFIMKEPPYYSAEAVSCETCAQSNQLLSVKTLLGKHTNIFTSFTTTRMELMINNKKFVVWGHINSKSSRIELLDRIDNIDAKEFGIIPIDEIIVIAGKVPGIIRPDNVKSKVLTYLVFS